MVPRNTTPVPSQGLRIGPACEAGLSAGMRREHVPTPKNKERKNHSSFYVGDIMAKFRLGPLNGRGGRMLVGYETETIQYRAIVTVERDLSNGVTVIPNSVE